MKPLPESLPDKHETLRPPGLLYQAVEKTRLLRCSHSMQLA